MLEEEKRAMIKVLRDPSNTPIVMGLVVRVAKSNDLSEEARQQGNSLYNRKVHSLGVHEETWQKYCLSIAVALKGSEKQALGYANRAAFLMHLSKHKEALVDIDRAISITKTNDSKFKFLCRKVKCLAHVNSSDAKKVLEEAKSCFAKVSDKRGLAHLLKEVEKLVADDKTRLNKANDKNHVPQFEKKTDDFSFVTIKNNSKYGRHLIATKDIQPGEVIFIEKPYVSALNLHRAHAYCSHCFTTCWNMIPCDSCSWCMYCSEKCKQESWEQYHEIECSCYGYCNRDEAFNYFDNLVLICLRLVISECKKAGGHC